MVQYLGLFSFGAESPGLIPGEGRIFTTSAVCTEKKNENSKFRRETERKALCLPDPEDDELVSNHRSLKDCLLLPIS